MSAKEYLLQYRRGQKQIETAKRQISKVRDNAISLSSPNLEDTGGTSSPNPYKMQDACAKFADMQNELAERIVQLSKFQIEAENLLDLLDDTHRIILSKRYLQGDKKPCWCDIAASLRLEERYIFRLHAEALESLQELLSGNRSATFMFQPRLALPGQTVCAEDV